MTIIDGLQFTQLTNLNVQGELYEHGSPFGGVTAPLTLTTANNATQTPLTLRGGATDEEGDFDSVNSGLLYKDGDDLEVWRLWGSNPDQADANSANLYLGFEAGRDQPTRTANASAGAKNTGIGYWALRNNTTGNANTGLGYRALLSVLSGSNNTAVGSEAGNSLATCSNNTAIGFSALHNATGDNNTGVGGGAMHTLSSGENNTAVGHDAGRNYAAGDDNTSLGFYAHRVGAGNRNVALGSGAMETTGSPNDNVFIGYEAGNIVDDIVRSIGIGTRAMPAAEATEDNIAIGYEAGLVLATTAFGFDSVKNVLMGTQAGLALTQGLQNVMVGYQAGYQIAGNSNHDNHVLIGYRAGGNLTGGDNCIMIGANTDGLVAHQDDQLNIGNLIEGDLSGTTDVTVIINGISDTDPMVDGALWEDNGVVMISKDN